MAAKPSLAAQEMALLGRLADLDLDGLRLQWRNHLGGTAPAHLPRWLLLRLLAYRIQAQTFGDLDKATLRTIRTGSGEGVAPFAKRPASTRDGLKLKSGSLLTREWQGRIERVMTLDEGFAWNGRTYGSLSQVAKAITGTSWNGHRFFGLKQSSPPTSPAASPAAQMLAAGKARDRQTHDARSAAKMSLRYPPSHDVAVVASNELASNRDGSPPNASPLSRQPIESDSRPASYSESASEAWT